MTWVDDLPTALERLHPHRRGNMMGDRERLEEALIMTVHNMDHHVRVLRQGVIAHLSCPPIDEKRTLVTINGIEHMWTDTERVTYEEIVRAAYPDADPSRRWSVTYRFRYSGGLGGSMRGPGDSIGLVDDMVFNVADTSNA